MPFPTHVRLVISLNCLPFETCSDVPKGNLEVHLHSASKFGLAENDRRELKAYVRSKGLNLIEKDKYPNDVLIAFSDEQSAISFMKDLDSKRVIDHWERRRGSFDGVSKNDSIYDLCECISSGFEKFHRDAERASREGARGVKPQPRPERRTTDPDEIVATQTGATRSA